jgi:hypothetical protein
MGAKERDPLAPSSIFVGFAVSMAMIIPAAAAEKADAVVAPPVAKAKAAILRGLPAPEITEFRNLSSKVARTAEGRLVTVVCGLVNTYGNGGFAGLQRFVFVVDPVQLIVVSADTPPAQKEMTTLLCG